jgi:hypothetical protein
LWQKSPDVSCFQIKNKNKSLGAALLPPTPAVLQSCVAEWNVRGIFHLLKLFGFFLKIIIFFKPFFPFHSLETSHESIVSLFIIKELCHKSEFRHEWIDLALNCSDAPPF